MFPFCEDRTGTCVVEDGWLDGTLGIAGKRALPSACEEDGPPGGALAAGGSCGKEPLLGPEDVWKGP